MSISQALHPAGSWGFHAVIQQASRLESGKGKTVFWSSSSPAQITPLFSRASGNPNMWGDAIHQNEAPQHDPLFLIVSSKGGAIIQIDIFPLCNSISVSAYLIDPSQAWDRPPHPPWQRPLPPEPEGSPQPASQVHQIIMTGGHTSTAKSNHHHRDIHQLQSAYCMPGPSAPLGL